MKRREEKRREEKRREEKRDSLIWLRSKNLFKHTLIKHN
jgi:hypothetical protein